MRARHSGVGRSRHTAVMGLLDRILGRQRADAEPPTAAATTPPPAPPTQPAKVAEPGEWRFRRWEFQGNRMPPLGEWSYAPVQPTRAFGLNFEDGEPEWEVVGESRFLDVFAHLVRAWREAGAVEGELRAILVHEPLNPFDKHAVRVDLLYGSEIATCGYMPREMAYKWHRPVREAYSQGYLVVTAAKAYGGDSPNRKNIGVWLGGRVTEG